MIREINEIKKQLAAKCGFKIKSNKVVGLVPDGDYDLVLDGRPVKVTVKDNTVMDLELVRGPLFGDLYQDENGKREIR